MKSIGNRKKYICIDKLLETKKSKKYTLYNIILI